MIASERSLASAHQPQTQQLCKPAAVPGIVGKSKNGKPPIRPVKVYVLDPKTLQQKLEAYVGQKNKREAEALEEKEREKESKNKNEGKQTPSASASTSTAASTKTTSLPTLPAKSTSAGDVSKASPPKQLPPIAPKVFSASTQTQNVTTLSTEGALPGNGVTLQCISTSGFGLPDMPLVVTNGVALLQTQTPSLQDSIQASGVFLPGITAIPNVLSSGVKPKTSSPQKKKAKKRKAVKKKKLTLARKDKDDEDDDDSELVYLRKETTTRLGRVSKPVSQPHSPAFSTAANSRLASPTRKKKKMPAAATTINVEEKLNQNFPPRPRDEATHQTIASKSPHHTASTNNQNQGKIPPIVPFPPVSSPQLRLDVSTNSVSVMTTAVSPIQMVTAVADNTNNLDGDGNGGKSGNNSFSFSVVDNLGISQSTTTTAPPIITFAESAAQPTLIISRPKMHENFQDSHSYGKTIVNSSNADSNGSDIRRFTQKDSTHLETNLNVSLVPTREEPKSQFNHSTGSSNVDLVPSSYSIPSSPPSQCHSPGIPDNNINANLTTKEGTSSPERSCNSPVDPMLLRSRSPFLPPTLETSLPSVSVSNLSIPEESLCRGELFMDLGESILETTGMNRMSSFCNGESVNEQLFASSPAKPAAPQSVEVEEVPAGDGDVDLDLEQEAGDASSPMPAPSQVVAPILTMEDANDGEIFQSANYARNFAHPSTTSSPQEMVGQQKSETVSVVNGYADYPKTPQSNCVESDVSMDSSENTDHHRASQSTPTPQKRRSVWHFVKQQIQSCGISQACGEISEMAEKLSRIARDQFIPIREEEIERLGNASPIIHVDTPFFSHLLDLPFGTYVFKEDAGRKKRIPPPPPLTSSDLSFTGGVDDVEKFLPPNIDDLIALPHLTNLDLI